MQPFPLTAVDHYPFAIQCRSYSHLLAVYIILPAQPFSLYSGHCKHPFPNVPTLWFDLSLQYTTYCFALPPFVVHIILTAWRVYYTRSSTPTACIVYCIPSLTTFFFPLQCTYSAWTLCPMQRINITTTLPTLSTLSMVLPARARLMHREEENVPLDGHVVALFS